MDKFAFMKMTGLTLNEVNIWYPLIIDCMRINGIIEKKEKALFLAVIMAESRLFTRTVDNMDYSLSQLKSLFYSRLTSYQIEMLAAFPDGADKSKALANLIWAKQFGNARIHDGWRFRPRGLIPVVGKENYRALSQILNCDLISSPELLEQPAQAVMSAGYLWRSSGAYQLDKLGALCEMFKPYDTGNIAEYRRCHGIAVKGLSIK